MSNVKFFICAALCLVLCPGLFAAEATPPGDDAGAVTDMLPEATAAKVAKSELRSALQEVVQARQADRVFAKFQAALTEYVTDPDAEISQMGVGAYFEEKIAPTLEAQGVSRVARVGLKQMFESWVEAEVQTPQAARLEEE